MASLVSFLSKIDISVMIIKQFDMGNDISAEIKKAHFDDYITECILMYLPYTSYMSLNKEYYSLGLMQIHHEDAKKILTKIIYSGSPGHEQLLDYIAQFMRSGSIMFNKTISLSYFTILHKHGFVPTHVLAQLLTNSDYEHIHEYILSNDSLVKEYPHSVIFYSIYTRNIELFTEMISYIDLATYELKHICRDLPSDEVIKFINAVIEHQGIHRLLANVIIDIVVIHNRNDIIDIIQNTNARRIITNKLLQEITVRQRDMRYVDMVEKIR